jgi:hypothetical protein
MVPSPAKFKAMTPMGCPVAFSTAARQPKPCRLQCARFAADISSALLEDHRTPDPM